MAAQTANKPKRRAGRANLGSRYFRAVRTALTGCTVFLRSCNRQETAVRPTVELSMIVKNGAVGLARCIRSVQPFVDRIAIGDTGSTDASVSIARQLGAQVFPIDWTEDYAAARNQVLDQAICDWVLVLDADEQLDPAALAVLPGLLATTDADAFQSPIWTFVPSLDYRVAGEPAIANPIADLSSHSTADAARYPAYFRTLNTRLFRRAPDIYFEHAIHESVLDRLVQLGRRLANGPFVIHHFGQVEESARMRENKKQFYRTLSLRKAAAQPRNARAQLEMGMQELDCGRDPRAALPYLLQACTLAPHSALAWLYGGICWLRLGDHAKASAYLQTSLRLNAQSALLHATLGDLSFAQERHSEARNSYLQSLQLGNASPLCLAKLGVCEVRLGLLDAGIGRIQQAEQSAPVSCEILDLLAPAALLAGQAAVAKSAVDKRLSLGEPDGFGSLLAASVYMHLGCQHEAASLLASARVRFPEDSQLAQLAAVLAR